MSDEEYLSSLLIMDENYTEDDRRWDGLLASEAGLLVLDRLVEEAMLEIEAGKGTSIVFTDGGELAPKPL
ncbi:MAG: hypothetical protein AAF639_31575 [Chloroflexota bacterium]